MHVAHRTDSDEQPEAGYGNGPEETLEGYRYWERAEMLQECQSCGVLEAKGCNRNDFRVRLYFGVATKLTAGAPRKSLRFLRESGRLEIPSEGERYQSCVDT